MLKKITFFTKVLCKLIHSCIICCQVFTTIFSGSFLKVDSCYWNVSKHQRWKMKRLVNKSNLWEYGMFHISLFLGLLTFNPDNHSGGWINPPYWPADIPQAHFQLFECENKTGLSVYDKWRVAESAASYPDYIFPILFLIYLHRTDSYSTDPFKHFNHQLQPLSYLQTFVVSYQGCIPSLHCLLNS